ncbi:hypothetical protein J6590_107626 [Homalodisca vitripennis]|nr:hypothetical protein J6590_107626 [Homalodisca vitripennis]
MVALLPFLKVDLYCVRERVTLFDLGHYSADLPNSNDNVQISDIDPDLSSDPDDTDEDPDFDINNERTKRAKSFNFDIGKGCKKIKKAYLGT